MTINIDRAAECIGRKVTYGAPDDKPSLGTIAKVDWKGVWVAFPEDPDDPELFERFDLLNWVPVLEDAFKEEYLDGISGRSSEAEWFYGDTWEDEDGEVPIIVDNCSGLPIIQVKPSRSPNERYLDIIVLNGVSKRAFVTDPRFDAQERAWEIEEYLNWAEA